MMLTEAEATTYALFTPEAKASVTRLMDEFHHDFREAIYLTNHDQDETLHPFIAQMGKVWKCKVCGDTEEGLMHNNTWRNVEPLMQE